MAAINTLQLVSFEQIEPLFHQLEAIKRDLDELKKLSIGTKDEVVILTRNEAMELLKLKHPYTFNNYLKNNNIKAISAHGPLRYKVSDLLKSK